MVGEEIQAGMSEPLEAEQTNHQSPPLGGIISTAISVKGELGSQFSGHSKEGEKHQTLGFSKC